MDLATLLPNFGNLAFTIAAFVLALSIIVAVHEYGHYIVGRWSGIHAEVFSIGFGPVLWSRADRRGTVWQIAALPFGGYVKFLGDADAASVTPDGSVSAADRRRTMHGAPLWARSATVAAGPVFNFIFSIIVFAGYIAWQGIAEDTPRLGAIHPMPPPATQLQPGDRITAVDGQPVETLADFYRVSDGLTGAPAHIYTVDRNGVTLDLSGPHPVPARASSIALQSAARDAGLQAGDVVVSVDGEAIHAFADLPPRVAAAAGRTVALQVWRPGADGGQMLEIDLTPRRTDLPRPEGGFETRWLIGLTSGAFFEHPTRSVPVLEVVPMAANQTWDVVARSISGLSHMIAGAISTCNLSGPVGIARTSGAMAQDGLMSFIFFLAVLSTAVGLLNLFPIPVLDGGHLVFHAWEAVTGKPPSDRALNVLMTVGIVLLGSLMLFALGNDLFC
jgi:regulator of sigma E protease